MRDPLDPLASVSKSQHENPMFNSKEKESLSLWPMGKVAKSGVNQRSKFCEVPLLHHFFRTLCDIACINFDRILRQGILFACDLPNKNQCTNCHSSTGSTNIIGPRIQNLNKIYNYASGAASQIDYWIEQGVLEAPNTDLIPAWPQFEDASADLNDKARAYLAVNCASCHTANGAASNSGLFLDYDNQDEASLGILKTPVAAGSGSGGYTYVIDPGNAAESILLFRMNSSEIDIRMPEIGRELIHEEGIDLIEAWINSLQ